MEEFFLRESDDCGGYCSNNALVDFVEDCCAVSRDFCVDDADDCKESVEEEVEDESEKEDLLGCERSGLCNEGPENDDKDEDGQENVVRQFCENKVARRIVL